MKMFASRFLFFCLFVFFTASVFALPATRYTGSVSYINDSNLTLGYLDGDILSDSALVLNFEASHHITLSPKTKLALSISPSITGYSKYNGLNSNQLDFKAKYIFQLANHFRSPQFSVYYLFGFSDYKANMKDNTHSQAGVTINWHLDDRTLIQAGYSSESVDADQTYDPVTMNNYQTFDTKRDTTYLGINLTQTSKLSLYASISLISGDIVANWRDSTFATDIPLSTQIAWQTIPDTLFANNWSSTKYKADVTRLAIGFNYAFSRISAIDIVYQTLDADAGNYSYDIQRISASYLRRF